MLKKLRWLIDKGRLALYNITWGNASYWGIIYGVKFIITESLCGCVPKDTKQVVTLVNVNTVNTAAT